MARVDMPNSKLAALTALIALPAKTREESGEVPEQQDPEKC